MVKVIRLLLFVLLCIGSLPQESWGKVTYHILTIPFTTKTNDGTNRLENIRVEAVRYTVDFSAGMKVGLPAHFKSPLAENFKYYDASSVTVNPANTYSAAGSRTQIYQNMTTTFDTYEIKAEPTELTENVDEIATDGTHIYVTYEYNTTNTIAKLDGSMEYNIKLGSRFLCFNKDRSNRPAAMDESKVNEEILTNDDFSYIATPGFNNNSNHYFHFRFILEGSDPYNITLRTAYRGDGTFSETDKALNKKVLKWYKGASLFCQGKADGKNNLWLSSDDDKQYTSNTEVSWVSKPGFYRGGSNGTSEMNPIWNSFAMLKADEGDGYVFMASKVNSNGNEWQPTSKGEFLYLTGNNDSGNNPKFLLKKPADAEQTPEEVIYEVKKYTYKVELPSGSVISATITGTEYKSSESLLSHVPTDLKRKYASFTAAYKDQAKTVSMSTFANADANADTDGETGAKIIWLAYESSMPFETSTSVATFDDLKWYNIYANRESGYVAWYDSETSKVNTLTGHSRYPRDSHFAFIGDPYELRIISRKASETAGSVTDAITGGVWGIVYDDNTGTNADCFRLQKSAGTYLGWNTTGNYSLSDDEAEPVRLTAQPLPKLQYVYHIMNSGATVAVKGSEMQEPSIKLGYDKIPEIIRSPFLAFTGVTLKFYDTAEKATAQADATDLSYATDVSDDTPLNIWVRYTINPSAPGADPRLSLINGATSLNVRLNGEYIYYDSGTIRSQADISGVAEEDKTKYQWILGGNDPYAMTIKNTAADQYVTIVDGDDEGTDITWSDGVIGWSGSPTDFKFIIKNSTEANEYEVMAATGDDLDAATTYYNIGRADANTVKVYSNGTYRHGFDQLRFLLTPLDAVVVTYHLIDKDANDLLQVSSRQAAESAPVFPSDYRSPLVQQYHYYSGDGTEIASIADAYAKYTIEESDASVYSDASSSLTATNDEDLEAKAKALTANGDYYYKVGDDTYKKVSVTIPYGHVLVKYDVSSRVDLDSKTMYLLEFAQGDLFKQEDGSDGLTGEPLPAVYPYCNGDGNFFIYGREQYDIQQQGAASTRTRWAWYLESDNDDPYHVKICSRQTEIYGEAQTRAYFRTYAANYGGANHVVTGLAWPGIYASNPATEYMILGSVGQYQLMTTYPVPIDLNGDGDTEDSGEDGERQVVNSFEQYWKTFDTIRQKIFSKDKVTDTKVGEPDGSAIVPEGGSANYTNYRATLTGTGDGQYGWHSYNQLAYAKRWNGLNDKSKASKGWEVIEHWYQTVNMGEGYFDLKTETIDPALILLDQHGWEIMRKPLPNDPDDPTKAAKYAVIKPYDSPMVEKYYFWTKTSKRSGFHQYFDLSQQVMVDGEPYASNSLTSLPPYDKATNLKDDKGNLLDQYVTYTVKDEYVQSAGEKAKFLIQQGNKYFSTADGSTITKTSVPTGGMSQAIITATTGESTIDNDYLWYLKPNADIDREMGYSKDGKEGGWAHSWTNDYDDEEKRAASGFNSNAFDPYNIQISSVKYDTKYLVTNATGAELDGDGGMKATYSATPGVSLAILSETTGTGLDNRTLYMTNATFMAVKDDDDNMQLMPRFDHSLRVQDFTALVSPQEEAGDADKLQKTYTQLFKPEVYQYRIIDHAGNESLSYQSGGDLVPHILDHFKSPMATNFRFHTANPCTDENLISESLVGATLTDNQVYVRYDYDESVDNLMMLQGKWLTMKLNGSDVQHDGTGIVSVSGTKDVDDSKWQWKFLETPQSTPDPYAVYLFNRDYNNDKRDLPLFNKQFALLPHTNGDYALATSGVSDNTYQFLIDDDAMATPAALGTEAGFTSTAGVFDNDKSRVQLADEVSCIYRYRIYTNGGVEAVNTTQSFEEAKDNNFVPTLPEAIKSPLLKMSYYMYYESTEDFGNAEKEIANLFGLYSDDVYVRYKAYDPDDTEYKVPNERNATDTGQVECASTSNDASIDLSGTLLYNVIWYNDNMMYNNSGNIGDGGSKDIQVSDDYEWTLEGNDPYAIKIKILNGDMYIHADAEGNTCSLSSTTEEATPFMLLEKSGYDYGILQMTGDASYRKLTGYGAAITADAATEPNEFIIFALATYKVIYHLVIQNIDSSVDIPYRAYKEGGYQNGDDGYPFNESTHKKTIYGSTKRDLTSGSPAGATYQLGDTEFGITYCKDEGHISLGDLLKVPEVLYRPNCKYFFYVEGVYNGVEAGVLIPNSDLNNKYKGMQVDHMGSDDNLLGKIVRINIEYQFDDGLTTNNGSNFVTAPTDNKWYTFETMAGSTPRLAQFTNAYGGLRVQDGRESHYTNDFLWSPVGDPYGFIMYNRYIYKTSNQPGNVMTTAAAPAADAVVTVQAANEYDVYELLESTTPGSGYFRVHPVYGKTDLYLKTVLEDGNRKVKLGTEATEFTFGLNEELMRPYYDRAGYIGGLNEAGVAAYDAAANLMAKQNVVYNDDYIVKYTPGYYRLHSMPNPSGISTPRYASGYLHEIEKTAGDGSTPIPMHFYDRVGVGTTYSVLGSGFTETPATRGDIPISPVEEDPASIFYFYEGTADNPLSRIQTQGLYLKEAKMTPTEGEATTFTFMDIGGAVFLIHNNDTPAERMYLNYDQTSSIYDLKYSHDIPTDDARWCIEPANKQGLKLETHDGGDGYSYATLYVPYDVMLPSSSNAYICSSWTTEEPVPTVNTTSIGSHWESGTTYYKNNMYVPAGTPVLVRTTDTSGSITMTLPSTSPSASILSPSNVFSARYLEQKLATSYRVYTFGLRFTSTVTIDGDGNVTADIPVKANTGAAFYTNANYDKESHGSRANWTRHNRYVLHNKIFLLYSDTPGARELGPSPVLFDPGQPPVLDDPTVPTPVLVGDVYDLMGRRVATAQQVLDGTWKLYLPSGVYIIGGKKVLMKRGN